MLTIIAILCASVPFSFCGDYPIESQSGKNLAEEQLRLTIVVDPHALGQLNEVELLVLIENVSSKAVYIWPYIGPPGTSLRITSEGDGQPVRERFDERNPMIPFPPSTLSDLLALRPGQVYGERMRLWLIDPPRTVRIRVTYYSKSYGPFEEITSWSGTIHSNELSVKVRTAEGTKEAERTREDECDSVVN